MKRFPLPLPIVTVLLCTCANGTCANAQVDVQCLAVETAFAANDIDGLADLTLDTPHWQALRDFRLAAAYIPGGDAQRARRAITHGQKTVRKALREAPDDVEMLLLGAMLDGQRLLIDRWRFIYDGLRGLRRLNRAERLAPDNSRVALIRGTAKVVLPGVLGGSAGDAIEILAAATDDSPLCEGGEWAQVDILNWLGRAHTRLGNHDAARHAYQRALQRSPDNHWVKLAIQGNGYEWDG